MDPRIQFLDPQNTKNCFLLNRDVLFQKKRPLPGNRDTVVRVACFSRKKKAPARQPRHRHPSGVFFEGKQGPCQEAYTPSSEFGSKMDFPKVEFGFRDLSQIEATCLLTLLHPLFNWFLTFSEKIETTIKLINYLSPDIKKKTVLRFRREYFAEQFGTKYIDFFKDLGVEIERGEPDISKFFYQTKLSLFNYDSTGVLENYLYNRPTLFMVNKDFLNCLTDEIEHKYQMLLDNNLMFIDE